MLSAMADLELTRSREDRRLYELAGLGTLRLEGMFSRRATAEAGGVAWSLRRVGFWRTAIDASDAAGNVVGAFDPRALRRGGTLTWNARAFELRPASRWKDRYALAEADREIAVLDGRSWGRRPVTITVDDPGAVDAGLLLFAAYVVRSLAEDSASAAGGAAAGATAATG
jgi:hypothetical protein